jgi:hypothetical protein
MPAIPLAKAEGSSSLWVFPVGLDMGLAQIALF